MRQLGRAPIGCLLIIVTILLWLGLIYGTTYTYKQVKKLVKACEELKREIEKPRSLIVDTGSDLQWSDGEKCTQYDLAEVEAILRHYEEYKEEIKKDASK